ncbi:hypothetical protein QJQ45_006610 [Haematococcus lacustris]|nr:hypothetical protein QJQ45_006610 [Haematococcus lacustris]
MNVLVVGMFGVMLFLSALLAAGDQIYTRLHSSGMWYLQYDGTWPELGQGFPGWIIQMLRFLILLNGMIPISLCKQRRGIPAHHHAQRLVVLPADVTLEMVKVLQCYIIYNTDRQMYHADSDTRFSCRTTTLNEDLGQVAYVLSDKTGTLTQNVMGFVWASIDTQLYGKQVTSDPKACTHIPDKTPHSVVLDQSLQAKLGSHFKSLAAPSPAQEQQQQQQRQRQPQEQQQQQQQQEAKGPLSSRPSTHAAAAGSAADPADPPDPAVVRYFINLAVCNTVVPQVLEDGSHVYQARDEAAVWCGGPWLQAASPDEEALVQGAAYAGYRLQARSTDKVEVRYHGQVWVYTVLVVLEFDSDRKRMSIICRCPDGKVRLFCKGADTMIMARVRPGQQVTASVRAHLVSAKADDFRGCTALWDLTQTPPGQCLAAAPLAKDDAGFSLTEEMAKAGYRTLCIAEKVLEEPAWATWSAQYHAASVALEGREAKIAAAGERIEQDLDLVGASAVEDKLQDGVPEAIEALVASGIKVWVLTGDKVETAISIALSCRLFTEEMALVELRERDFDQALTRTQGTAAPRQAGSSAAEPGGGGKAVTRVDSLQAESQVLAAKLEEVDAENLRLEYERAQSQAGGAKSSAEGRCSGAVEGEAPSINKVGLVIEGGALALALKPEHQDTLMKLCNACKSVVCCRVSPMQKAAVTKLVQAKCGAITLGIGDGANDVASRYPQQPYQDQQQPRVQLPLLLCQLMVRVVLLQAAHIGVGISGREGRAAVLASDFSFAQFRYVARLVLWHGRATYKRNLEVVLYSFYKNWAFNMTYVYFAFLTAFSSQPLYTTGLIATLNLCWASLPIIAYALFEQDVSNSTVMANPTLYAETMNANRKSFFISQAQWLGLATWHSLVVFFLPVYSMSSPDEQGLGDDWVAVGCGCYVALVLVLNLRLAMRSSISLFFPFLWLYGLVWPVAAVDGTADMSWVVRRILASSRFWLAGVLLAPIMSLLLDFSLLSLRRHLKPQAFEVYQEVEHLQAFQRQALQALQKAGHVVPGNSLRKEVVEMQATV